MGRSDRGNGDWGLLEDATLFVAITSGIFLLVGSIVGTVAVPPAPPGAGSPLERRPDLFFGVAVGASVCGSTVVACRRLGVLRAEHLAGSDGRRFWEDALLLAVVVFVATYGLMIALAGLGVFLLVLGALVELPAGGPRLSDAAAVDVVLVVLPWVVGAVVVALHRRDRVSIPAWLATDDWGFWENVWLFVVVSAMGLLYSTPIVGDSSLLGTVATLGSFGSGVVAVELRDAGVFDVDEGASGG